MSDNGEHPKSSKLAAKLARLSFISAMEIWFSMAPRLSVAVRSRRDPVHLLDSSAITLGRLGLIARYLP